MILGFLNFRFCLYYLFPDDAGNGIGHVWNSHRVTWWMGMCTLRRGADEIDFWYSALRGISFNNVAPNYLYKSRAVNFRRLTKAYR